MGIFSRSKNATERVLLMHIGSSSVTGCLVDVEEKKSTLVASITSDIAVLADLTQSQFEREMEHALRRTLNSISDLKLSPPNRCSVYLASPWYASQVRVAKASRPTTFVVSQSVLDDMVTREIKAFEDEEMAQHKGTHNALRAIEKQTLQVTLNGYPNASPIGVSVKELALSVFISVAPEHMLARIEEILTHTYHKSVSFATSLSATFLVVRDFFPHQEEYLLMDIGGEVTDISLVRENTLVQSVSFPFGRNYILRKLARGLGRSLDEAAVFCMLYAEDKVEASMKASCDKILGEAKNRYLEAFQNALYSLSSEISVPDTLMLSSGADVSEWFTQIITHEDFHQYALSGKELKVVVLGGEIFHDALQFGEGVRRDPVLMIEALAETDSVRRLQAARSQ